MKIESGLNMFYIGETEEEPLAKATYRIEDEKLYIDHVFVMPQLRGQGIAADLVEAVISYAKDKELQVVPICSYAKSYLNDRI